MACIMSNLIALSTLIILQFVQYLESQCVLLSLFYFCSTVIIKEKKNHGKKYKKVHIKSFPFDHPAHILKLISDGSCR